LDNKVTAFQIICACGSQPIEAAHLSRLFSHFIIHRHITEYLNRWLD